MLFILISFLFLKVKDIFKFVCMWMEIDKDSTLLVSLKKKKKEKQGRRGKWKRSWQNMECEIIDWYYDNDYFLKYFFI